MFYKHETVVIKKSIVETFNKLVVELDRYENINIILALNGAGYGTGLLCPIYPNGLDNGCAVWIIPAKTQLFTFFYPKNW